MSIQENHERLKNMIIKAMEDQVITRDEYDMILHIATEEGVIDSHERTLLDQLQEMIESKTIKFGKKQ